MFVRIVCEAHIEPLNDTNWETWNFVMEQYLTVNDLWDVVAGVETVPADATETQKAEFLQKQWSACARIALPANAPQLNAVRLETDSKVIWDELQRLNRPGGFGTRMALRRELSMIKKDPEMSMSKWVTSVRDIARKIKDLKGDIPDEEIIVTITSHSRSRGYRAPTQDEEGRTQSSAGGGEQVRTPNLLGSVKCGNRANKSRPKLVCQ